MGPPDDASESGSPDGSELKFDQLLISESFSPDNYEEYSLTTCVSWLRSREYEASMWALNYRLNRSELHETLVGIRSNLVVMFRKMDRLCGGSRSYLAVSLGEVPIKTQKLYKEFLAANDGIGDVLEEYIAYANHYKTKYAKGEIPDTKPPRARQPPEMREELFEKLDLLQAALRNLAASLEGESAGTDTGEDAPDRPERRSA